MPVTNIHFDLVLSNDYYILTLMGNFSIIHKLFASIAQLVEYIHGKDGVISSSLIGGYDFENNKQLSDGIK